MNTSINVLDHAVVSWELYNFNRLFKTQILNDKSIKKSWKIGIISAGVILLLVLAVYGLFRSSRVQTILVQYITHQLSGQLNTEIKVGGVDVAFWDHVILEDVLIRDLSNDTLFFSESVDAAILNFEFRSRKLDIDRIKISNPNIQLNLDSLSVLNAQFLLDSIAKIEVDTINPWKISFIEAQVEQGSVIFNNPNKLRKSDRFDTSDLQIQDLNFSLFDRRNDADSLSIVEIRGLEFKDHSGFRLNRLDMMISMDDQWVRLYDVFLHTPHTTVSASQLAVDLSSISASLPREKISFYTKIDSSKIGLKDFAFFEPKLKGMNLPISYAGKIRGSVSSLKGDGIHLKVGNSTYIDGKFSISGLPDFDNAFVFADFNHAQLDFAEIDGIKLPKYFQDFKKIKIPDPLKEIGPITYHGNFSGFPSDFVAYGTVQGSIGELATDIAIRPSEAGAISLDGRLITKNLHLGKLTGQKDLGKLSVHAKVLGTRYSNGKYKADINGMIDSISYRDQVVHEIYANGTVKNEGFDGEIYGSDPNLSFFFNGKADLDSITPVFKFSAGVENLNLVAFDLDPNKEISNLSLSMDANFEGAHLDSVIGRVMVQDLHFIRNENELTLENIRLETQQDRNFRSIQIRSDFMDVDLKGDFAFKSIRSSFSNFIRAYLPHAKIPVTETNRTDYYSMSAKIKESKNILPFVFPNVDIETPFDLSSSFDGSKQIFQFHTLIPSLSNEDYTGEGLEIFANADGDTWQNRIRLDNLLMGDRYEVQNTGLFSSAAHDTLKTVLSWNNNDTISYSGRIGMSTFFEENADSSATNIAMEIHPSKIWISDSLWTVQAERISMDSTQIDIANFGLVHADEGLKINGRISSNPSDSMSVDIENIHLIHLNELGKKDLKIRGLLDGGIVIKDWYNDRILLTDLKLEDFSFKNQILGNIFLNSQLDAIQEKVGVSLRLQKDSLDRATVQGGYFPDSKELDFEANFYNLGFETLYPVLTSFADDVEGEINGQLNLTGTVSDPSFDGEVQVTDGRIDIAYTKVPYFLNDKVSFSNDSIIFDQIKVTDEEGNLGEFDGYILHKFFQNLRYNMRIDTDYILGLNTSTRDSDIYFGKAHASGSVLITGVGRDIRMDLALKSEKGTNISIPLEGPEEAKETDFIRFVKEKKITEKEKRTSQKRRKKKIETPSGFEMYFDLTATPDANIQIIFDESSGDLVRGTGYGELRMVYDREKNITMFGDFTVDQGDYTFTLQNFINKKFKVERGGTIHWSGDPYNAILDVNAIYSTRASLYDLFLDDEYSSRVNVDAIINLTGQLSNPKVGFDIDFPTSDRRLNDEVAQFLATEDEVNRQILSLLIMGQFYTPEYLKNDEYDSSSNDLVGSTTSELLSNQFSNWLSQISTDFDIGFNYRPGDDVSDREVEVALSTQLLDNRVTINGNIGNNGSLQSDNSNDIVGEVDVYVKLTKNGKLQLKAYNHSNDDLIYDTAPYTQGIGFSYREEFDNFDELLKMYEQNRIERKRARDAKRARKNLEKSQKEREKILEEETTE